MHFVNFIVAGLYPHTLISAETAKLFQSQKLLNAIKDQPKPEISIQNFLNQIFSCLV